MCDIFHESLGPSYDSMPTRMRARALPPPVASLHPTTLELPPEPLSNLKSKYGNKGGPIGDKMPSKLAPLPEPEPSQEPMLTTLPFENE